MVDIKELFKSREAELRAKISEAELAEDGLVVELNRIKLAAVHDLYIDYILASLKDQEKV